MMTESPTAGATRSAGRLPALFLGLVLACAVFFLFRWLLGDVNGFASYVPYLAAASTLLTIKLLIEQAGPKDSSAGRQKGDEPIS